MDAFIILRTKRVRHKLWTPLVPLKEFPIPLFSEYFHNIMKALFFTLLMTASIVLGAQGREDVMDSGKTASIVLGGGCFWCIEAVFERVPGVVAAEAGYAGGARENPTYEQVCTGLTGHAEVVKLTWDPELTDLQHILDVFFTVHDPTTENRQGADVGTQYRSIILYSDEAQRLVAQSKIADLEASKKWRDPIVTQVLPLKEFWKAEEYHQDYYEKNPFAGYCRVVIAPKLQKAGFEAEALVK